VTYNYLIEGWLEGFYNRDMLTDHDMKLMHDFKDTTLARFQFFTEIKVDSGRNRAIQTIWTGADKRTQVTKTLVDFNEGAFYELN